MEKHIKIEIPEGYEIDKDKSTFEKIVFKEKIKYPTEIPEINNYLRNGIIYENNNKGLITDIERYDKTVLFNIKNNDKNYLIPYNDNLIDKIDINNKKIYIKDIKGLFNN